MVSGGRSNLEKRRSRKRRQPACSGLPVTWSMKTTTARESACGIATARPWAGVRHRRRPRERSASGAPGGGGEESATWSWYDNPFVGTREFNGLRVMMALVNNWDLKDVNNRVSDTARRRPIRHHRPGRHIRAHWQRHHPQQERLEGLRGDQVHRQGHGHARRFRHAEPALLSLRRASAQLPVRTRMQSIVKHIPIADAGWLGDRLGHLSPAQIRDCFRASGFSPADIEMYSARSWCAADPGTTGHISGSGDQFLDASCDTQDAQHPRPAAAALEGHDRWRWSAWRARPRRRCSSRGRSRSCSTTCCSEAVARLDDAGWSRWIGGGKLAVLNVAVVAVAVIAVAGAVSWYLNT